MISKWTPNFYGVLSEEAFLMLSTPENLRTRRFDYLYYSETYKKYRRYIKERTLTGTEHFGTKCIDHKTYRLQYVSALLFKNLKKNQITGGKNGMAKGRESDERKKSEKMSPSRK